MNNKEWKANFLNRLLLFGVGIIKLCSRLPKTPAGFAVADQLIRSSTSIGANAEEAQDASSIKEFIQKLSISLREAKESRYWLKVIDSSQLLETKTTEKHLDELNEIIALLTSIIKSSKVKLSRE